MATPIRTPFELTGTDGKPLRGDVRTAAAGAARPAVVICHGFKGFKDWGFFPPLAERLARAGFTAVSFNFSASGVGPDGESFSEPERFRRWTYSGDLEDLATVLAALRGGTLVPGLAIPPAVGLFGHSRGGAVAVLHSAGDPGIGAVVTWAAVGRPLRWGPETVSRWRRDGELEIVNQRTGERLPLGTDVLEDLERNAARLDLDRAAAAVRVPWLLAHGAEDVSVPLAEAQDLHAAGNRRAELLVVPRASHTFGARHPWAGSTPELDLVLERTVDWFARHLAGG